MSTTIKPSYGSPSDITPGGLQGLVNTSSVATGIQPNTSALAQDIRVQVTIAGTMSPSASLQVFLLISQDGIHLDTQASAKLLGLIYLTATPQQKTFSMIADAGLLVAPEYYAILVVNNTGNSLSGSGNSIIVTPVNMQSV